MMDTAEKEMLRHSQTAITESLSFSSTEEVDEGKNCQSTTRTNLTAEETEEAFSPSLLKELNENLSKYKHKISMILQKTVHMIEMEGVSFRKALTTSDIQTLKLARFLFHCCSVIPPLLYYSGTVELPPKFPATISFTIRKGPPRLAQMILWTAGWACMGRVINTAGSKTLQRFSSQMYLTGVLTTQIFKLGQGKISDFFHFIGASMYMLDHVVLLRILRTKGKFRKFFYTSFALLAASMGITRVLEKRGGLPMESEYGVHTADRFRRLDKLPLSLRKKIFLAELLVMISENLLFTSFVHGMPSGIQEDNDSDSLEERHAQTRVNNDINEKHNNSVMK